MRPRIEAAFGLEGRVAVVTGAGSGIGRETAILFAEAGATVVLADIDEAGLADTARATNAAILQPTDVRDRAQVEALAERALAAGGLHVWANIAGTHGHFAVADADEAEVDRLIAINLKGTYWGCSAAARAMRDSGGGSIINVSSSGADSGPAGMSVYAMTKGGVNSLTKSLAREMGPFGVRANVISPGFVETPLAAWSYRDAGEDAREAALAVRRSGSPLGRIGEPEDIGFAMLYLASDASRFVTGQNFRINGGVSML